MLDRQNHAAGGAHGSIGVGMFVCWGLASKKPSEQEFFVPAGTDLGVKLLSIGILFQRHMVAPLYCYMGQVAPRFGKSGPLEE